MLTAGRALAAPCDDPAGATVSAVVVTGAQAATDEEVRTALGVKPGDTVAPIALAKLEDAVLGTGWFERASVVIAPEGDACVLRVRVVEWGIVERVELSGVTAFDASELRAAMKTQPGTPANRRTVEADAADIVARYQVEGYEAARIASIELGGGVVAIRFSEGVIARVDVRGARLTGRWRVRRVLGIQPGSVYNSRALIAGQAALYRTGLFSSVGFGVEPLDRDDTTSDRLVLTVTVTEHRNPFSRTEVFAGQGAGPDGEDAGFSSALVEARLRNVGGGNSLRVFVDVLAPAPDGLAQSGFDEFFRLRTRVDFALFRPEESSGGGLAGLEAERVRGRRRSDLGFTMRSDAPAVSAGIELPVVQSARVLGLGGFAGALGYRDVWITPEGAPEGDETNVWEGLTGRGEVGIDLRESGGMGLEPSRLRVRAGLEMHDGLEPFSFATLEGRFVTRVGRRQHLELSADAALLSGEVPFFRETALGGREGPAAYGPEHAFARRHARGTLEYAIWSRRSLAGASAGVSALAWGGANDARGVDDEESAFLELRLGPEFARIRAGVAAPLPYRDAAPWLYAGVVIASPY